MPEAPSTVRFEVLALTASMSVLLYLDRICISAAAPRIMASFHLSKEEMGAVFSAFFLAYALSQVPTGWLGDRLGPRLMLAGSVLAWSVFTALTGFVPGLTALIVVRLLFGICQAGAYPIAGRIYSLWIPFPRRAFANSLVALGGRAGGALAPILTTELMVFYAGWREIFWVYSILGLGWAGAFWMLFRNSPADQPRCNQAERNLIELSRPPEATSPHGKAGGFPLGAVVRSWSLWMQCLAQFASNISWVLLITWLPKYLMEVYRIDEIEAGRLASLPLTAGVMGCFLGGIITDRLTRSVGLRWGRALPGVTSKFLAGLGMLAAAFAPTALLATLALTWSAFTTDLGLSATWAYFQDAGGKYVGTLLGWANMFGNLGAFLSPLLLGWIAEEYDWATVLAIAAALYGLAAGAWFGIDATVPIVREEAEK